MTAIGRYQVSGVIGSGGFGTVYLGTDPSDGSPVAVKVLDRGNLADPAFRTRMRAEAAAMRQVADPHCARVRDVVDEPGVAAIVTDLVDGASLRAVLDRHGRLSGPQSLDVLSGALHGLVAVHGAGLLHGDLKPDNVLVDRRGVSRLIDFGLAAAPATIAKDGRLTGSPSYLSPEQIRGEPADVRSDVYACAVMLFELLCGRRPYAAATVEDVLAQHLSAPVPDPRDVDASVTDAFARLCVDGMAKDPAERPQTAADFLARLEDAARARYGAAWRTGLGLGALVGGLVATGAGEAKAATALTTRLMRRAGVRAVAATGAVAVVVAAVVITVRATTGETQHGAAAPALTGTLLVQKVSPSPQREDEGYVPWELRDTSGALVERIPNTAPACCRYLSLSPDGARRAFVGAPGIGVEQHGGPVRSVWFSQHRVGSSPAWSPDGSEIAFSSSDITTPVPSSNLEVINADGSGAHIVTRGTNIHSIAWSPDGRQLAFAQNQGGIWLVSASGGAVRGIVRPMLTADLSWAPQRGLLFAEVGTAPTGVWSVLPDGSGLHSVLPGATSPSWAPDGLHFAAVRGGRVVIADRAGRVVKPIGPKGVQTVQWSASG